MRVLHLGVRWYRGGRRRGEVRPGFLLLRGASLRRRRGRVLGLFEGGLGLARAYSMAMGGGSRADLPARGFIAFSVEQHVVHVGGRCSWAVGGGSAALLAG